MSSSAVSRAWLYSRRAFIGSPSYPRLSGGSSDRSRESSDRNPEKGWLDLGLRRDDEFCGPPEAGETRDYCMWGRTAVRQSVPFGTICWVARTAWWDAPVPGGLPPS